MSDLAIVYMVAGMSSRFGGKIKQFAKVGPNGETLIQYSLNQAIKAGFNKIVFIVGKLTEIPFKEMFGNSYNGIPISYAKQDFNPEDRDKPWGTCDSLCSASQVIDCPFVVCNGDDIYGEMNFRKLAAHLKNSEDEATLGFKLVDSIPDTGKANRAIFSVNNGYVQSLIETFSIEKSNFSLTNTHPEDHCSMNIYALHPKVIPELLISLEKFKKEHQGDRKAECLLPAEITNIISQGKIQMRIYPAVDKWVGVTSPEDEEITREILKNSI